MLILKTYNLPITTTLSPEILKAHVELFWNDVFKTLYSDTKTVHLMLICKVEFNGEMGYRTIGQLRFVNFSDKELFATYLIL